MFLRPSALTGFWIVTSAIWIRPPGVSTRKISADGLLVRDQVDHAVRDHDVEARFGERQLLRLALHELDVPHLHLGRSAARLRQHLRCHVDSGDVALLADHLRGDERVGAGAGAEVEHPFAGREPAELPRVCDPGERADGGLGHVRELRRIAEVFGPWSAGREDEVLLRLLRDRRVRLLDLALQDLNVDLDLNGHYASSGWDLSQNATTKGAWIRACFASALFSLFTRGRRRAGARAAVARRSQRRAGRSRRSVRRR